MMGTIMSDLVTRNEMKLLPNIVYMPYAMETYRADGRVKRPGRDSN